MYADSVPEYEEEDNSYAVAGTNASSAIVSICGAVDQGAAATRAPLIEPGAAPEPLPAVASTDNPEIFLMPPAGSVCAEWNAASDRFDSSIVEWQNFDANIAASEWSPSDQQLMQNAATKMQEYSTLISDIGARSDNPTFRDFAELAAIYWLSYSKSLPTHVPSDNYLSASAAYVVYMVYHACEAAR